MVQVNLLDLLEKRKEKDSQIFSLSSEKINTLFVMLFLIVSDDGILAFHELKWDKQKEKFISINYLFPPCSYSH